ncbi:MULTISPECIES: L,D-transpeptidase [unclassified Bradyrhizobium]|uniref:L,D-transpeptidase n=1 Tax=unclassified Bradyrhizobium TaxID=2631580 RepID=UPI002915F3FD|nr:MULTISPECIES: L,D-transpeptidase [unclassified Bradyrhizobium]
MVRLWIAVLFAVLAAVPAGAATLKPDDVNTAELRKRGPGEEKMDPVAIRAQVILDRTHVSPREIDGRFGDNAKKALAAFAASKGLDSGAKLTPELWAALMQQDQAPAIVSYQITKQDLKGPFVRSLPKKMERMKRLPSLGYTSPREDLAEKFHMSQDLLAALNPGKSFDKAGEEIFVANVLKPDEKVPQVTKLAVDKNAGAVQAYDADSHLFGFFPATVGSEDKPTPVGNYKVTSADPNPTYRYNPNYKFKGVKARKPFTIEPGPNNPVGSYWIGLSVGQGYGIHGTADPSKVGKTESHGCIRLTNWDAQFLGAHVKKGAAVELR